MMKRSLLKSKVNPFHLWKCLSFLIFLMMAILFICWWTLTLLHVLAIINSAAMNTGVHVPFSTRVFVFSGYTPRSGIVGSYGSSILSFLRNLHTVFHSSYTNLLSHQQSTLFSTPSLAFIICKLFDDDHSDQCEWCLIVVFICTSLIISSFEHLFICLLAIYMSFWRNVYLGLLVVFDWVFFFLIELYEFFVCFGN